MSKAKTLATTVSTGGVLDNPSAIPAANISGAVGSATNLAGGSNGTIPYQSASGTTQMLGVGTASQVLTSAGVGAPTWATPAATGVTSVAATVPSIFSIAGSPITSTGTLAMTYSGTALPIANGGTGTTSTTFANLTTNVTGTLPIANGGTNSTATPTAGTVPYGTGTAFAFTSAGTSGQLLQSNGASAPTWVTASAGALTFLSTVTASSSPTVDIETTFNGTYDAYLIVASNIRLSNQTSLYMRLKIAGSYISTGTYFYHCVRSSSNGAIYGGTDQSVGGNTQILIADTIGNDAEESASIQFLITGPTSTTQSKQVSWSGSGWYNSLATISQATGVGGNTGTGALTGVRFLPLSGQISVGTFRLYGIANS